MKEIVVYKSKYGSTGTYAKWIGEELSCEVVDARNVSVNDLVDYDTIIYGGGLYAEVISGVSLITKNLDKLSGKKLVVFTTGITPLSCRDYYDKLVLNKNFSNEALGRIKVYNFMGKMILSELSLVHRTAIRTLKKIMSGKENPSEMEKLLITLCDCDGDFTDRTAISELVSYVRS